MSANSTVVSDSVSADAFRHGMRRLSSGVSLIACELNGERHGLVASSVSSLSAEPPSLLVCVNHAASSYDVLRQAGQFAVNVLAQDHADLCAQFSQSSRRHERFLQGDWHTAANGAPYLADAMVSFICRLEQVVDWATHGIFIASVQDVIMPEPLAEPMVYFNSAFHRLAGK